MLECNRLFRKYNVKNNITYSKFRLSFITNAIVRFLIGANPTVTLKDTFSLRFRAALTMLFLFLLQS